jgi:beta-galactosidase
MTSYQSLRLLLILTIALAFQSCNQSSQSRLVADFNSDWSFNLGEVADAQASNYEDASWRKLNLPHDWSIEGDFDEKSPTGVGGGALVGGIGWYRKSFTIPTKHKDKKVFIQFDGVYQNSTVWLNGQLLGNRPNGYISFQYDLTPFLKYGDSSNVITVKVNNAPQPNSRWYSGSGIYRDVRLVFTNKIQIDQWGTYISASDIAKNSAKIRYEVVIKNESEKTQKTTLKTIFYDAQGAAVAQVSIDTTLSPSKAVKTLQIIPITNPIRWDLANPHQYKAVSSIIIDGQIVDQYETLFGVRDFRFDRNEGFSLNGKNLKIKGVCLHHDLGCIGTAFNVRAMERQLEIMKAMGVNAIRTSHNPPAPQMLDLCDKMGFLVMDEMFDMWAKRKTEFDYSLAWDEWHVRDLQDFIKRDRNHPSIIVWSVGNEIVEQYAHDDSTGGFIAKELAEIVRELDNTRPITTANNDTSPDNPLIKLGGLDLVGLNYHHEEYANFLDTYPGRTFIATETNSSLATRGHYDMPSDSVRKWPIRWDLPFTEGNADNTVSAYDNVCAPWGSTQEDTWKVIKKHDFLSGMFIWTGFDYIGEPTPYEWPSRSSYFGVVDLAGFPKDTYYMYQSEWSSDTVLHVFPHWNWEAGQTVDVWAYYNYADRVELWLNGKSLGSKSKTEDQLHAMWRIPFEKGELKAISYKGEKEVLTKITKTAGAPYQLVLSADRKIIKADGYDLSFITIKVLDQEGNVVPDAADEISFEIEGNAQIIGVDNGNPVSHESFKAKKMKAFHGLCLAVVQSSTSASQIKINASANGLQGASIVIQSK